MLPVGQADLSLFLNPDTKAAVALADKDTGLAMPKGGALYTRVASVFNGVVHVLSSSRSCAATITASRSSALYVWEVKELRRLAGEEALRLFTFSKEEVAEYSMAAKQLKISSTKLTEMAVDSFVVVVVGVVAKLMQALVKAFSQVASQEEMAPWIV